VALTQKSVNLAFLSDMTSPHSAYLWALCVKPDDGNDFNAEHTKIRGVRGEDLDSCRHTGSFIVFLREQLRQRRR
jgi:hypothetical protein